MKPLVAFTLNVHHDGVIFYMDFFDERLRKGRMTHSFEASNGFLVRSWTYPEISESAIYLPGSNTSTDWDVSWLKPWRESPITVVEKAVRAVKEFIEFELNIHCLCFLHNGRFLFIEYDGRSPLYTTE